MTLILTLTIFTCVNFALFVVNVPTLGDEAWVVQSSGDDGSGVVDKFGTSDLYSGLLLGLAEVSDERGWYSRRSTSLSNSFCSNVTKQVTVFFVACFNVP